jgi:hypothetical protein
MALVASSIHAQWPSNASINNKRRTSEHQNKPWLLARECAHVCQYCTM